MIRFMEENQVENNFNMDFFMDYEKLKHHLVFRVINREKNQELLEKVPYKELQDLAIVCHCLVESDQIGTGSILIHKHHLKTWKISKEQLFMDTEKNSPIIEPWQLHKMSSLVREILSKTVHQEAEEICEEFPQDQEALIEGTLNHMVKEMEEQQLPMYVLTNTRRYYGAASLVYHNVMEKIAKFFDNDYYILPSSVHELILLEKTDDMDPNILNEMIRDVNETQVEEEEWLSDHAYLYHRNKGLIPMVGQS